MPKITEHSFAQKDLALWIKFRGRLYVAYPIVYCWVTFSSFRNPTSFPPLPSLDITFYNVKRILVYFYWYKYVKSTTFSKLQLNKLKCLKRSNLDVCRIEIFRPGPDPYGSLIGPVQKLKARSKTVQKFILTSRPFIFSQFIIIIHIRGSWFIEVTTEIMLGPTHLQKKKKSAHIS